MTKDGRRNYGTWTPTLRSMEIGAKTRLNGISYKTLNGLCQRMRREGKKFSRRGEFVTRLI